MLKRSNSFKSLFSPSVGIEAIGERLKVINPYAGTNPEGLCYQSAIETAEVLTNCGRDPKRVDFDSPDDPAANAPHIYDKSFGYNNGRRTVEVWAWLKSGAVPPGAVFIVEMDASMFDDEGDSLHCWNFVKGSGPIPSIYLIDSSTHQFKEVVMPCDFFEWRAPEFAEPMEFFNYASPEDLNLAGDDLMVYYWGQLTYTWTEMLQRPVQQKSREAPF